MTNYIIKYKIEDEKIIILKYKLNKNFFTFFKIDYGDLIEWYKNDIFYCKYSTNNENNFKEFLKEKHLENLIKVHKRKLKLNKIK